MVQHKYEQLIAFYFNKAEKKNLGTTYALYLYTKDSSLRYPVFRQWWLR